MVGVRQCRLCGEVAAGARLPVLAHGGRLDDWYVCRRCWAVLRVGVPLTQRGARLERFRNGGLLALTESQVRDSVQMAVKQLLPEHWPVETDIHDQACAEPLLAPCELSCGTCGPEADASSVPGYHTRRPHGWRPRRRSHSRTGLQRARALPLRRDRRA